MKTKSTADFFGDSLAVALVLGVSSLVVLDLLLIVRYLVKI